MGHGVTGWPPNVASLPSEVSTNHKPRSARPHGWVASYTASGPGNASCAAHTHLGARACRRSGAEQALAWGRAATSDAPSHQPFTPHDMSDLQPYCIQTIPMRDRRAHKATQQDHWRHPKHSQHPCNPNHHGGLRHTAGNCPPPPPHRCIFACVQRLPHTPGNMETGPK